MLVCTFVCANRTRDRGCSVHPVFAAPSEQEGGKLMANLGRNAPREYRPTFSCHRPRRRTIQYSRDISDRTDRPRRTGYPAFAGYDDLKPRGYPPVIASEAKQSIYPRTEAWIASLRSQ